MVFIIVKQLLTIFIVLFLFLLGCKPNHIERMKIDPDLRYHVEEWVNECKKHNVDYNYALKNLDSITFMDFAYLDKLGEHNRDERRISINTYVKQNDFYFQRLIVFHELGHALNLHHICGKMSVMNPYLSHEYVEDYNLWWEKLMKDYFVDTVGCNEYFITKDTITRWIETYGGYCDYSNSTIGPR